MAQLVKNLPAAWETWVQSMGGEDPLEKGKATHSSILAGDLHGLCSPWGRKELDTSEQLSVSLDFHFSSYLKPLGKSRCTDLRGCPGC